VKVAGWIDFGAMIADDERQAMVGVDQVADGSLKLGLTALDANPHGEHKFDEVLDLREAGDIEAEKWSPGLDPLHADKQWGMAVEDERFVPLMYFPHWYQDMRKFGVIVLHQLLLTDSKVKSALQAKYNDGDSRGDA
jgi:hypothetical protein